LGLYVRRDRAGTAPLAMVERGATGAVAAIAPYLFVAANIVVGLVAIGTVKLIFQGRMLPKAAS
jgi:tellurite resistance protein